MENVTSVGSSVQPLAEMHHYMIMMMMSFIIGIPANCLIIAVIVSRPMLRASSFMQLLLALAVVDNLNLAVTFILKLEFFIYEILEPSIWTCQIVAFAFYLFRFMSSWLVVLISTNRMIAVYYPLKVHIYCSITHTYLTIAAIAVSGCVLCSPVPILVSVSKVQGRPLCNILGTNFLLNTIFFFLGPFMFFSVIPFMAITILNTLVIRKVWTQAAFRTRTQQAQQTTPASAHNQTTNLVGIMCSVSILFVVLTLPTVSLWTFQNICNIIYGPSCVFGNLTIRKILSNLFTFNYSLNLFIYCMTGSVFRTALIDLVRSMFRYGVLRGLQENVTSCHAPNCA